MNPTNIVERIAVAKEKLRGIQANLDKESAALQRYTDAGARAAKAIQERDEAQRAVEQLRQSRSILLAEELLGDADKTVLAKSDRELRDAEARLKDLEAVAERAKIAMPEIENRYRQALAPTADLSKRRTDCEVELLHGIGELLLEEYLEAINQATQKYLAMMTVVGAINRRTARDGVYATVFPERAQPMLFPCATLRADCKIAMKIETDDKAVARALEIVRARLTQMDVPSLC